MKLTIRPAVFGALSLALTLFAAAPVKAQVGLVGIGNGSYTALSSNDTIRFSYLVLGLGNGAADGLAVWRGPGSVVVWRVTSVMSVDFVPGTTSQAFAGPILAIFGTPPPGGAVVGSTAFTASNDNGRRVPDGTASLSVAPTLASVLAMLPPPLAALVASQVPNLETIQNIVLLGQLLPFIPGPTFAPLLWATSGFTNGSRCRNERRTCHCFK